jgi:uncharacterized membrane protein
MFVTKRTWILPLVVCVFILAPLARAKTARLATIDYPGATQTFALGINPAGDVVGAFTDAAGEHGFVMTNGHGISFDWPGATWTDAYGINPQGDIVGQYGSTDPDTGVKTVHGFLRKDGTLHPIDVLGQPNTMPVKINAEGTIVGCYHVGTPAGVTILDTMYGFVRSADGAVTSHPMSRTMNNGVNPAGDIVGTYFSPTSGRAEQSYLLRDGTLTWFQAPGSIVTQAYDISPNGTIVGWYRTSLTGPLQFHGFVMEGDEITSIDVPGSTETRVFGVSATGDIVGYYRTATGYHGFLLSAGLFRG